MAAVLFLAIYHDSVPLQVGRAHRAIPTRALRLPPAFQKRHKKSESIVQTILYKRKRKRGAGYPRLTQTTNSLHSFSATSDPHLPFLFFTSWASKVIPKSRFGVIGMSVCIPFTRNEVLVVIGKGSGNG